jgi:hypothetical protein
VTGTAEKLREVVRGRVLDDRESLDKFSRDRSIYEIRPQVAVLPEDSEDVRRLVEFSVREGLPITPRGGGSGLAGSALGRGLVMALPQNEFWSRISGFSEAPDSARISASAGVYHNELQKFLKQRGFFLPADVERRDQSHRRQHCHQSERSPRAQVRLHRPLSGIRRIHHRKGRTGRYCGYKDDTGTYHDGAWRP